MLRVERRAKRLARGVGLAALRVDGGVETVPACREPHNWRRWPGVSLERLARGRDGGVRGSFRHEANAQCPNA